MGYFTNKIQIEPAGDKLWKVLRAFSYITGVDRIDIPKDFLFDGASIPKIAWILIGHPIAQEYLAPACVHDWLCEYATWPRKKTDRIFLKAMRDKGVAYLKRMVMYWCVCLWSYF